MRRSATKTTAVPKKREQRVRLAPLTAIRRYRLERAVSLNDVASVSGMSTARVSFLERGMMEAGVGEIERLLRAVDKVAAQREATA
jgi:predicted transcriptional regulator